MTKHATLAPDALARASAAADVVAAYAAEPLALRIRALLPSLIQSEARVATVVLNDSPSVVLLSVTQLAERAGSSASTVVRLCQRIGFRGYQDLKIALAQELIPAIQRIQSDVSETDDASSILDHVLAASADATRDAGATIDRVQFVQAVDALAAAQRVLFLGVGTSAPIAQDAAYRFATIGIQAQAPPDVHVQHVSARLLAAGDVCVAVSHTGQTHETVAAVTSAAAGGAKTVAVTSFVQSPLAEIADVVLIAGSRETRFRVEAMASRIAHVAVLDALFVALAMRDAKRATEYLDLTSDVLGEHRF
jgi:RpiR family carbohydrate utilization transcriptional regulator